MSDILLTSWRQSTCEANEGHSSLMLHFKADMSLPWWRPIPTAQEISCESRQLNQSTLQSYQISRTIINHTCVLRSIISSTYSKNDGFSLVLSVFYTVSHLILGPWVNFVAGCAWMILDGHSGFRAAAWVASPLPEAGCAGLCSLHRWTSTGWIVSWGTDSDTEGPRRDSSNSATDSDTANSFFPYPNLGKPEQWRWQEGLLLPLYWSPCWIHGLQIPFCGDLWHQWLSAANSSAASPTSTWVLTLASPWHHQRGTAEPRVRGSLETQSRGSSCSLRSFQQLQCCRWHAFVSNVQFPKRLSQRQLCLGQVQSKDR